MVLKKLSATFDSVAKNIGLTSALDFVPSNRPDLADFQSNDAMKLAKTIGTTPRELAEKIVGELKKHDEIADASVAGPGFINIKISDKFLINAANESISDKFQISAPEKPFVIDLDYGSYNIAKALHIGHLRTTVVGDTLNRISKFLGHKTISYNHIGDWGRPMGMVICWIRKLHPEWPFFQTNFDPNMDLSEYKIDARDLEYYYPLASDYAKQDPEFMDLVKKTTTEFQAGHPGYQALYKLFLPISIADIEDLLNDLNVLPYDYWHGEKNASKNVPAVEKLLRDKNLLILDDGAMIVRVATENDNAPMPPLIFESSHGADTYGATDLGAIYYRVNNDHCDFNWYFTDLRQKLHFTQVFRVAEMIGLTEHTKMEHLGFGTITGADGKPFKTRDGGVPTLRGIIDMLIESVQKRVADAGKELSHDQIKSIAISALKFNDLMHDNKSDYVFDPDMVTNFEGKTGPYILYTAVRMNSILKRAGEIKSVEYSNALDPMERSLLLAMLDFERTLNRSFDSRTPDVLANYTYDLAQIINTYYHHFPIMRDDLDDKTRVFRLKMISSAYTVLSSAINLMGMNVPENM